MKYVKIECTVGFIGAGAIYYVAVPEGWNENEINEYAGDLSEEHASEWSGLATADICPEDYSNENEYEKDLEIAIEDYWENCVGFYWNYVSEDEWREHRGEII